MTRSDTGERPIPPAAQRDPNSVEMIRVWVAEHGLHASIRVGMYKDTNIDEVRAWGIIVADIIRHLADALNESEGLARDEVVAAIVASKTRELEHPTSKTEGSFVG